MVSKKLFSAILATLVILSIVGPTIALAQTEADTANVTKNATKNVTRGDIKSAVTSAAAEKKSAVASAAASKAAGFLEGVPGFEALYAVAGLLVVAFLVILRRK